MGFFSGGKGKKEQSSRVDVPEWLQPFIQDATANAGSTMSRLAQYGNWGGDQFIAPFTEAQQLGQQHGINTALGAGGYMPTALNALQGAAGGTGLDQFLDPSAYGALSGAAGGQSALDNLDPASRNALNQFAQGQGGVFDQLGRFGQGVQNFLPTQALSNFESFLTRDNPVMRGLDSFASRADEFIGNDVLGGFRNSQDPSIQALQSSARGDNLFGGPAFDRAVKAAIDQAKPAVASAFGGRTDQSLADASIGEAAVNAFAGQYGQERDRMLGAANSLNRFGLDSANSYLGRRLGALNQMGQFQQGAANSLGNFASQDQGRALNAAQTAGQFQLGGAQTLGGYGMQERGNQLGAANTLAGFGDNERMRALQAAQALPESSRLLISSGLVHRSTTTCSSCSS